MSAPRRRGAPCSSQTARERSGSRATRTVSTAANQLPPSPPTAPRGAGDGRARPRRRRAARPRHRLNVCRSGRRVKPPLRRVAVRPVAREQPGELASRRRAPRAAARDRRQQPLLLVAQAARRGVRAQRVGGDFGVEQAHGRHNALRSDRRRRSAFGQSPSACSPSSPSSCAASPRRPSAAPPPRRRRSRRKTIATGLQVPWGIAFLPDGDALVAERTTGADPARARERRRAEAVETRHGVDTGRRRGRPARPRRLARPTSATSSSTPTTRRPATTASCASGSAARRSRSSPASQRGFIHNGGRIAFGPDGKLYAGVGRGRGHRPRRRTATRSTARSCASTPTAASRRTTRSGSPVWSLGHRNVQGLAFDREGRLWATEFGQNTFDEVNLIRARAATTAGRCRGPAATRTAASTPTRR